MKWGQNSRLIMEILEKKEGGKISRSHEDCSPKEVISLMHNFTLIHAKCLDVEQMKQTYEQPLDEWMVNAGPARINPKYRNVKLSIFRQCYCSLHCVLSILIME